jgi:hypothetical protein
MSADVGYLFFSVVTKEVGQSVVVQERLKEAITVSQSSFGELPKMLACTGDFRKSSLTSASTQGCWASTADSWQNRMGQTLDFAANSRCCTSDSSENMMD